MSSQDRIVEMLITAWRESRQLTLDFLREVPLEALNHKLPRPGLDTLAKHLLEMALVQQAYTEVLKGNELDFSAVAGITFGQQDYVLEDKTEIEKILQEADTALFETMQKITEWEAQVEIFGERMTRSSVLELMIRHETLHHGQIIAFSYLLGITFPKSWVEVWALPVE